MGDTQSCLFGLWLLLDRSACGQRRSAVHKSTGPSFRVSRPLEATVIDVDEAQVDVRSEEHTSELQSRQYLVCRLLLEKKKKEAISSERLLSIGYHARTLGCVWLGTAVW